MAGRQTLQRSLSPPSFTQVTLWDTAGQERFRTLTSTFYRGAKGAIFVYDITRAETLAALENSWMPELRMHAPNMEVARMVIGNKCDQVSSGVCVRVEWARLLTGSGAAHTA